MLSELEMAYQAWLLELKSDFLTTFFKLFPYLVSDYFFITVIAVGFWLNPGSRLFKSLGFLIPFSALLNCTLKDLIRIPRPDPSTHLLTVSESFGFPSGDVQVGAVFWFMIMLALPSGRLQKACLVPIVGIAVSRYYLGVHSMADVVGGLIIALATIYVWYSWLEKKIFIKWQKATSDEIHVEKAWYLLITMSALYGMVSQGVIWSHIVSISIGALIGFCCFLQYVQSMGKKQFMPMSILFAFCSLVFLVLLIKIIPVIKTSAVVLHTSLILKYGILFFLIFVILPAFYSKLSRRKNNNGGRIATEFS